MISACMQLLLGLDEPAQRLTWRSDKKMGRGGSVSRGLRGAERGGQQEGGYLHSSELRSSEKKECKGYHDEVEREQASLSYP